MVDSPALARLRNGHFNTGDWNAGSNPGGMGGDGHRYAMVPPKAPQVAAYPVMVNDVVTVADEVAANAVAAVAAAATAAVVDGNITALQALLYIQAADPGAVGAGKVWCETTAGALYIRNAANTSWQPITLPGAATETLAGIVELATTAEVNAGTDNARAVTPAGLAARTATDTRAGIVELATTAEVNAGADAVRAVTPAGLAARLLVPPVTTARTSNTAFTAADTGKTFTLSGTFTQTYVAGAGLPPGWNVRCICLSGTVTHDPNGAEAIGGVATATQVAGDVWDIEWNGTAFLLARVCGRRMVLLTSGTSWTPEAGVYSVLVEGVGGGGGMEDTATGDGGGGPGGRFVGIQAVTPGVPVSMSIGAAGTSGASPTAGGATSFGSMSANGGQSGSKINVRYGGTATGGVINSQGSNGVPFSMGGAYVDGFGGLVGGALMGAYGSGGGYSQANVAAQQGAVLLMY